MRTVHDHKPKRAPNKAEPKSPKGQKLLSHDHNCANSAVHHLLLINAMLRVMASLYISSKKKKGQFNQKAIITETRRLPSMEAHHDSCTKFLKHWRQKVSRHQQFACRARGRTSLKLRRWLSPPFRSDAVLFKIHYSSRFREKVVMPA